MNYINFLGKQESFDVCNAVLDSYRLSAYIAILKEIGWPGIAYREGIESALLVSNSALVYVMYSILFYSDGKCR